MRPLDLRAKCREYALRNVDIQRKDFIRFGVLGDWQHPYLTLQKPVEVAQIGVFGEMAKKDISIKVLRRYTGALIAKRHWLTQKSNIKN